MGESEPIADHASPREQHSLLYGGWIFNCDADLPTFSFGVGDTTITVPSDYMNYATVIGSKCYGGLQPSTDIGINVRTIFSPKTDKDTFPE